MISIIDYGAGNLNSVRKAFAYLQVPARIVTGGQEMDPDDNIVLPGVGAFGAAVEKLHQAGFWPVIKEGIKEKKKFLGICLGMQLLMDKSDESPGSAGLGIFAGSCRRFDRGKVPQIGWNQISFSRQSPLLSGISPNTFFYFVHSYYVDPVLPEIVSARTDYFGTYPSIIEKDNITAVQFHPEKSGRMGMQLLKNWVEKCWP